MLQFLRLLEERLESWIGCYEYCLALALLVTGVEDKYRQKAHLVFTIDIMD